MHADWLILSSIRVWINKILIHVKSTLNCKNVMFLTNEILTFSGTVDSIKKWEKLLTIFASLNNIHASLFMASLQRLFASFIPGIWPYGVLLLKRKQIDVSFLCLPSYWWLNCIITLSNFVGGSAATLTMLWPNFSSKRRQPHKKLTSIR